MKTRIGLSIVLVLTGGCAPQPDAQFQALLDRQAIDQLVAGDYPRALDAQDWDAYVAHFTADGELSLGPQSAKGPAEIRQLLEALPSERINHVISNSSYEIDGDTATGGSYWQDIGLVNGAPGVAAAGHYDDTLRKVDGVWKFAKRAIVIDFAAPGAAE
jgi:ketosteroid isomerase-like protein